MINRIKVIEITQNGEKRYVTGSSCFEDQATDPLHANNYMHEEKFVLDTALRNIAVLPGDNGYAKSGIRSETLPIVVEFVVHLIEDKRSIGRDYHK